MEKPATDIYTFREVLSRKEMMRIRCICYLVTFFICCAYGALPSSYDLRTSGVVTAVRDQRPYGTCWAFAAMSAYESSLCRYENLALDLSENNMINLPTGGHAFEWHSDPWRAVGYLVSWQGPVLESVDTYPNPGRSSSRTPLKHVQNVRLIPARTGHLDNDSLKTALIDVGAAVVGYYHDDKYYRQTKSSYYNNDSTLAKKHQLDYRDSKWHCVTVVGWDDGYSRYNFQSTPPGNGAFIVKNSWGSEWGDKGYFYVSYYDESFAWTGAAVAFPRSEETDNYDDIYQYDPYGATGSYGYGSSSSTTCWGGSMFTMRSNSKVAAVGFYALSPNASYTVYVYTGCTSGKPRSGKLAHSQSGKFTDSGYYTVLLSEQPSVAASQRFSIVIKLNTPKNTAPLAYSEPNRTWFDLTAPSVGQTFYSADGSSWKDFSKSTTCFDSAHFCCKAYVQKTDSIRRLTSVSIVGDTVVRGGKLANLSCKANYSDGSASKVSPTWLILDGVEYATLSSAGLFTGGVNPTDKTVTVMACYSSGTVTKTALHKIVIPASYTVKYEPGASCSTGSPQTAIKSRGTALTLLGAIYVRAGYMQTGWSRRADGSTKDFELQVSYTADAAVTLYPYWTAKAPEGTPMLTIEDGVLTSVDLNGATAVSIPDGVTKVGDKAFYGCSSLLQVSIPDSVKNIGDYAFGECSGLTRIDLSDNIASIGQDAFFNCRGLVDVVMSDGVVVGAGAFKGCAGLAQNGFVKIRGILYDCLCVESDIVIPKDVITIGRHAFYRASITSVIIPTNVVAIQDGAFGNCSSLTNVVMSNSLLHVGEGAFSGCSRLTDIALPQCVLETRMTRIFSDWGRTIVNISICEGVTNICSSAFAASWSETSGYVSKLQTLTIPSSVTRIGSSAFSGCVCIKNVNFLPPMLTELSSDMFYACGRLESVVIPPRVTKVAVGAFAYCRNLKTVYAPRALQGQIQSAAFVYGASDVTIVYYTPVEITFDATMGTMPDGRCAWTLPFPGDMPMGNLPLPTRDNCEFIGWFTAAAGGVQVTPETAAAIDATYYAHWSTNVYMVRFDANDGNGDMSALVMKPGSVCILPKCAFTPPAGKRFAGWACSNGRRYDDGMLVFDLAEPGETVTMTAIWE